MMEKFGKHPWSMKETIKHGISMAHMALKEDNFQPMMKGMLGNPESWAKIKSGVLCMYDEIVSDGSRGDKFMTREEVESLVGRLSVAVQAIVGDEKLVESLTMMCGKVHWAIDQWDLDTSLSMVYNTLMRIKSWNTEQSSTIDLFVELVLFPLLLQS